MLRGLGSRELKRDFAIALVILAVTPQPAISAAKLLAKLPQRGSSRHLLLVPYNQDLLCFSTAVSGFSPTPVWINKNILAPEDLD